MLLQQYDKYNIGDIVQYIVSEIEGPLADKLEYSPLTFEESKLFKIASSSVSKTTTRDDWDNRC